MNTDTVLIITFEICPTLILGLSPGCWKQMSTQYFVYVDIII